MATYQIWADIAQIAPGRFFVTVSAVPKEERTQERTGGVKTAEARSERVLNDDEEELSRLFGIVMEKKTAGKSHEPPSKSPIPVNKRSHPSGRAQQTLKIRKRRKATGIGEKPVAGRKTR